MVEPSLSFLWDYLGTLLGSWCTLIFSYRLLVFPFVLALISGAFALFRKIFNKGGVN